MIEISAEIVQPGAGTAEEDGSVLLQHVREMLAAYRETSRILLQLVQGMQELHKQVHALEERVAQQEQTTLPLRPMGPDPRLLPDNPGMPAHDNAIRDFVQAYQMHQVPTTDGHRQV